MTAASSDQPPPKPTGRRPSWDIVISYVEALRHDHGALGVAEDVVPLVLSDMLDRDAVGRARYGMPLTSGNGRDHLIDAYQEQLDACVYLMNELDEHRVGLTTLLTEEAFPDRAERWHLRDVQQLCLSQIRMVINLRAIIEERGDRLGKERAS